jgi:hypothetical protein
MDPISLLEDEKYLGASVALVKKIPQSFWLTILILRAW